MSERELVEQLGDLEVGDRVRVTLSDGTTFGGQANPIDYVPEESLRVEIRPEDDPERYEIRSKYEDGWSEVRARGANMAGEATEWEDLGTVEDVERRENDEE
jgi:hypothetical protein